MHLLLLFLPVVLGGTSDPIELGKKFKKEISKDDTFKVQIRHSPTKPVPLSSIISIQSKATSKGNFSSVNIVAVSGRYSETWSLANGDERLNTFCIDNYLSADHINLIVQLNDNYATSNETRPKIELELLFTLNEAMLKIPSEHPKFNVTDEMPYTLVVLSARPTSNHRENFVLTLKNEDVDAKNVCAVVTLQPMECPLKNQANNFESAVIYATMLEQATLTIRTKDYRSKDLNKFSGTAMISKEKRVKLLSATIKAGLPYSDYVIPIAAAVGFIASLVLISCGVLFSKQYDAGNDVKEVELEKTNYSNQINGHSNHLDQSVLSNNDDLDNSMRVFIQEPNESVVDTDPKSERIQHLHDRCLKAPKETSFKVKVGLRRLRKDATLEDMSSILKEDVWFRRNRSRVYLYLIPIVGVFYFIPAIQFAFLAKMNEENSGSLDLCYHNFGCSHPFNIFSDFNHVVSNMSFLLFGIAFVSIVKIKASKLAVHNNPKFDHISQRGIMQQLSIFYGMGVSLIFQALFSVCYHVCPTNLSLQFDTTMMYIICILVYIKIYQFRHPDVTPNAYSIMMMVGVLVFLEALILYSTSWYFYGMFILFYIGMTIFVAFDCYYIGIGRLDISIAIVLAKEVFSCPFNINKKSGCVIFLKRFISHLVFCLMNFGYAAWAVLEKYRNPDKSVSHVALNILAGNLIAYLMYYLYKKNNTCCRGEDFTIGANGNGQHRKHKIEIQLTAGSFFGFLAFIFGAVGIFFYGSRNADRNLSAAESRNLNDECSFMGFYDNHDLWHFFGAAGIFMAFSALLTIDDDLLNVPRNQIPVF